MLDHNWFTISELEEVLPQRARFQSLEDWILENSTWFLNHVDDERVFVRQSGDVECTFVKIQFSVYEEVENVLISSYWDDGYGNLPDRLMHW